jgi:hypothetical protein
MTAPGGGFGMVRVAATVHAEVTWSDGTTDVIDATQVRLHVRVHKGRLVFDLEDPRTQPLVMTGQPDKLTVEAQRYDHTSTLTIRPRWAVPPEDGQ